MRSDDEIFQLFTDMHKALEPLFADVFCHQNIAAIMAALMVSEKEDPVRLAQLFNKWRNDNWVWS